MSEAKGQNYYDNFAFYADNKTGPELTTAKLRPFNNNEVAVSIRDVQLAYGRHRVLTGINMTVPAKQIYGLLGPSGCGK